MTATAEVIHIDEHQDFINAVVHGVWRRYQGYVDIDDLLQEAALWWYGKGQKYLAKYVEPEGRSLLRLSIYRVADAYARSEKAARVGYRPQDQYPYHAREVADLIPIALDPLGVPEHGHHEGPAPKGNLAEGGDVLAALVDVRRALHALPEADVHFLTLADDCKYDWERVAVRLAGGAPDSMRRRFARIAERMARWLSNQEDDL